MVSNRQIGMDKASLRQALLAKRKSLTQIEADKKSELIAENVIQLLEKIKFDTIHTFLPQRDRLEVNTWKIISGIRLLFPGVQIVAPYVVPKTKEMEHYLLTDATTLVENQWGIAEPDPATSEKIFPENIDVILVPLLAFDKNGFRVGYGGGYYDRFLAKCRPDSIKMGLSPFEPVEEINDINVFDVRMNECVTPGNVWHW